MPDLHKLKLASILAPTVAVVGAMGESQFSSGMHTLFALSRLQKGCEQPVLSGLSVFLERTCEVGTEECWRDSGGSGGEGSQWTWSNSIINMYAILKQEKGMHPYKTHEVYIKL